MRDCSTASTDKAPLQPNKRVNYTFGMVLREQDFRQEQEHFEWKHRISNLLLHGYGTVCGLQVSSELRADISDVELRISPGYAISPLGSWIWVESELCSRLNQWLQGQKATSPAPGPGLHTVFVKLCYAECEVDLVPIVGNPCASEEDTRAASRMLETARAELTWERPSQVAEDAFRQIGDLLGRIEIVQDPPSPDQSQILFDLVRSIGSSVPQPVTSPPLTSPPHVTSPPIFSPHVDFIQLWEGTASATIREA